MEYMEHLDWPWPVAWVRTWQAPWRRIPAPESVEHARFAEAWDMAQAGAWQAARGEVRELLQGCRDLPAAWNLLGIAELHLQDVEQALASFSVLSGLAGRDVRPHNNLAVCHHRLGRGDWAEAALRRALQIAPSHPVVLGNLMSLLGQGEVGPDRREGHRLLEVVRRHIPERL